MFIGSINRYMRAVLETASQGWRGRPVYVACSGNFTVERILAQCGAHASQPGDASQSFIGAVYFSDVSIYSCALGWHLASRNASQGCAWYGHGFRGKEQAVQFSWLQPCLAPFRGLTAAKRKTAFTRNLIRGIIYSWLLPPAPRGCGHGPPGSGPGRQALWASGPR